MPNAYSWEIEEMRVNPSEAGLTNVVKRVVAHYIVNDGIGNTARQPLNVELDPPNPAAFTPFAELTFAQVTGWLEAKIDLSYWQANLSQKITDSLLVNMDCPWD